MRTLVYENINGIMAAIDRDTGEYLAGGPQHCDVAPETVRAALEALGVATVLYYTGRKGLWRNPLLPVPACFAELRRAAKRAKGNWRHSPWKAVPVAWIGDGDSIYRRAVA